MDSALEGALAPQAVATNRTVKTGDRSLVEQIKSKLDIIDVINETVQLHHEGGSIWAGAISSESKTGASLKVNRSMQTYYDFAGNVEGGDIFNWLAYIEKRDYRRDFTHLLRIAASRAGIQIDDMSEQDIQRSQETAQVQNALTKAAEIYHKALTTEIREYIHTKWGISDKTIDDMQIGYAKPSGTTLISKAVENIDPATLQKIPPELDPEIIEKTGLFIRSESGSLTEFFKGRVVFPYWKSGKVVSFAARGDKEKLGTPDNEFEQAKYKKLLTHNDKHPYVHESVDNRYIFVRTPYENMIIV